MNEKEQTTPSVDYIYERIRLTQHAKERYAERIAGMNSLVDIKRYVSVLENEKKIKTDLAKMLTYGKVIYTGKPLNDMEKSKEVELFLTGSWILVVEVGTYKVITLYKIDFLLGEDFNKEYIARFTEKINAAKDELTTLKENNSDKTAEIHEKISHNNDLISKYKKILKLKETENSALKDLIDATKADEVAAEMKIRDLIGAMIGKKSF